MTRVAPIAVLCGLAVAEKNFASLFRGPPPAQAFLLPPVFLARISSNFGAAPAEMLVAGLAATGGGQRIPAQGDGDH
jgi:hypothetical protein